MAIKGLEQAVENLSRISKTAVPGAAAMAIMYGFVVNDAPDQAEDSGPAEPVSAGKCSTVS
ncbi:TPA: phage tail protein [Escherichia coli]|nr:phage tail protein [Escherichia coli]